MKKVSTNPLINLTIEELNTFLLAIDNNFSIITIKGEVKEDLHTKWWDIYGDCLQYAYWNHKTITQYYPKDEDRTYVDIIKLMIYQEIDKKNELK
jgi:hypothetical protein